MSEGTSTAVAAVAVAVVVANTAQAQQNGRYRAYCDFCTQLFTIYICIY